MLCGADCTTATLGAATSPPGVSIWPSATTARTSIPESASITRCTRDPWFWYIELKPTSTRGSLLLSGQGDDQGAVQVGSSRTGPT